MSSLLTIYTSKSIWFSQESYTGPVIPYMTMIASNPFLDLLCFFFINVSTATTSYTSVVTFLCSFLVSDAFCAPFFLLSDTVCRCSNQIFTSGSGSRTIGASSSLFKHLFLNFSDIVVLRGSIGIKAEVRDSAGARKCPAQKPRQL